MKRILFIPLYLFVILCVSHKAQNLPDSLQLATLENFWKENPDWYVSWDYITGSPSAMYGPNTKSYGKTPEESINNFISKNYKLFKRINKKDSKNITYSKPTLKLSKKRDVKNDIYYDFQQEYKSIPISGTHSTFGLTKNGEIFYFSGTYYSELVDIDVNPKLSSDIALNKALRDLRKVGFSEKNKKLFILPIDNNFELVWEIIISNQETSENFKYIVSANSGKIMSKSNTKINSSEINFFNNESTQESNSSSISLNVLSPYGYIFNTFPQSSNLIFETTNAFLPLLNSSGFLQGTYANVYKRSGLRATYLNNNPANYNHDPYTQDFDEVNVYYHITKFRQDFINSLYTPNFNQTNVSIGWNFSNRQAYYDSSNDIIYFDNGTTSSTNYSREANVIYHEYIHKVQYDRNCYYGDTYNLEYKGVLEGLADYFAYVYSRVPNILIYSLPSEARNLTTHTSYNTSMGIYNYAHLFSHLLWELESSINGLYIVVFSHMNNFNYYNSAFISFRNLLINSYSDISIRNNIQNKFAEHGVGDYSNNPPSPPINLNISGNYGGNPTIQWTPSNDNDINHYKIYRKKYNENDFTLIGLSSGNSFTDYSVTIQYNFIDDDIYYFVKTVDNEGLISSESASVNVLNIWSNFSIFSKNQNLDEKNISNEKTQYDFNISNYPNPFNPTTTISYSVPEESNISIRILNVVGQEIDKIFEGRKLPGNYVIKWDGSKHSSGIYIVILQNEKTTKTLKIQLIK